MKKDPQEAYNRMNYDYYDQEGDTWWRPDTFLNLIVRVINPVRVEFAKRTMDKNIQTDPGKITLLDVGCGGGLLAEEFAVRGYTVTGIDPSESSLQTAREHAESNNLQIDYIKGTGERLPFKSGSFDVVLCCDVLEHVQDLPKVISEVSRVLKTGGLFMYDTFNPTAFSKLSAIRILQEWKRWAIMPPGLHIWEMFIKPVEIRSLLAENNLTWIEHKGIEPDVSYLKMLRYLRKRAIGELTFEEFSKKIKMVESSSTRVMYLGSAVKTIDHPII
jgi:2-polyprenyl-6-hydroxyphenyl methylase/3-demethylubiquinone-9 3-methyltransferase